jgi:hypothetical protein
VKTPLKIRHLIRYKLRKLLQKPKWKNANSVFSKENSKFGTFSSASTGPVY